MENFNNYKITNPESISGGWFSESQYSFFKQAAEKAVDYWDEYIEIKEAPNKPEGLVNSGNAGNAPGQLSEYIVNETMNIVPRNPIWGV